MYTSFLELKIVATNLTELNRLIDLYSKQGFIHDGISQEDNGTYWTFLHMNNGLLTETWDYKQMGELSPDLQIGWNQTLVTKLNSILIYEDGPFNVNVPKKLEPLIKSLMGYKDKKIIDKYNINFVNVDSEFIDIDGIKLQILNYLD